MLKSFEPLQHASIVAVSPQEGFFSCLSGVCTSNLLNDLEFYLGQILSLYEAKSLGKYLAQIFSFIKAQIKLQIVQQIGCVDAALPQG